MNRLEAIQKIAAKIRARTYLEIGVRYGTIFLPVRARRKIAIDPAFQIPWHKRLMYPSDLFRSRYHALTSDDFFARIAPHAFATHPIDIAFIDGLHTYEQSLKDVENCLRYLSPTGIIVMHDCYPPSAAAALPTMEASAAAGSKAWCGDVWKAIVRLRSAHADLDVSVLDADYGLGIVRKGTPQGMLAYSPEEIATLSYDDLARDPRGLLNLKPASYLQEMLYAME